MTDTYVVMTFAPVQGFIEKSRKLRDLYGSSYLLSYLAWIICNDAENRGCKVVSPALPNMTQGMPNQIIIDKNGSSYCREDAESTFNKAWECVTKSCRLWIENNINNGWDYRFWRRNWNLWNKYTWEFFYVEGQEGDSITRVRELMNEEKRFRAWTGINWQGESSTLSGADAIACPHESKHPTEKEYNPTGYNYQLEKAAVSRFYTELSEELGESFIDPREQLSIPELIKRLITHEEIIEILTNNLRQNFSDIDTIIDKMRKFANELNPRTFRDLSRWKDNLNKKDDTKKYLTAWFQGDGDKAGDYLKQYPERTTDFSKTMRQWGEDFQKNNTLTFSRVIYAGGDDFLGVFYDAKEGRELNVRNCVEQFSYFKSNIWHRGEKKPITVSVGFVLAGQGIPQRDVLQHCREAEKSAKTNGRDRLAFRILFNNGNYLEWVCPWWLLEQDLLFNYRDREDNLETPNWTHIYSDVAVLESRHAFNHDSTDIAIGLLDIYFPDMLQFFVDKDGKLNKNNLFNDKDSGVLGERSNFYKDNSQEIDDNKINQAFNDWVINLAKVGFHLLRD
jgi:CRISPR-associated protein Cmr2